MTQLTIFYDGGCPLCVREMRHLKRLDQRQQMAFEDINAEDFNHRYPQVSFRRANKAPAGAFYIPTTEINTHSHGR